MTRVGGFENGASDLLESCNGPDVGFSFLDRQQT